MSKVISLVGVERKILFVRGCKVLLDRDLAVFYGISTSRLNEQVKRNPKRFPDDFMFQLSDAEIDALVSQNAIPSRQHLGGSKPRAFTEQGIAMLSSVLNSDRAVEVNIAIMRAFVKLRDILATHKELERRLFELEQRMDKKDNEVLALFETIRRLMAPPPEKSKGKLGFVVDRE